MTRARHALLAGVAALSLGLSCNAARAEAPTFAEAMAAVEAGQAARAVAIFATLAQAGDAAAQLNLAVLTAQGRGLPQNDLDAAYWAWRARLGGLPAAVAPSDHLLARLAPEAATVLAQRLAADLDILAEEGAPLAFLALARLELQLAPLPDTARAYGAAAVAAALGVAGAEALRDALAQGLDGPARLAAQAQATARFADWCDGRAIPECGVAPAPEEADASPDTPAADPEAAQAQAS
ncbi:sel1 repeat family protein [Roseicyclus mahoneyensis]|uniref:Sel1 repeat-containing protein n=1 Tax=Roseicyclus mahoneyensis TaxID=164332 RepID=A0A316GIM0_9RHOB|nr:sel1 repeat family protein [Roseicyclus mahoneyensis]PWK60374.1 hypothetical protein C7455_10410 [Roseicyclus mahoneyensis]